MQQVGSQTLTTALPYPVHIWRRSSLFPSLKFLCQPLRVSLTQSNNASKRLCNNLTVHSIPVFPGALQESTLCCLLPLAQTNFSTALTLNHNNGITAAFYMQPTCIDSSAAAFSERLELLAHWLLLERLHIWPTGFS